MKNPGAGLYTAMHESYRVFFWSFSKWNQREEPRFCLTKKVENFVDVAAEKKK